VEAHTIHDAYWEAGGGRDYFLIEPSMSDGYLLDIYSPKVTASMPLVPDLL
jgi:hypothetical protein